MGYLLRMSDEIRDWLVDLPDSDPLAARRVAEALTALITDGPGLGPPLVVSLADTRSSGGSAEALDGTETVQRHPADAGTLVIQMEQQIAELESLEARLADQRWRALQDGRPEEAARAVDDLGTAQVRLAELRRLLPGVIGAGPAPQATADGLMELRPGAPGDADISILFAVEPPGTALLIAVLEGREAVQDDHDEAVRLSAGVLAQVREGQAPHAGVRGFDDVPSFLDEFFPGSADEVEAGAAALSAGNRARTLAEQRALRGLTREQVAGRMGVRPERVSAIERAEPGATEVRTLARYVAALGGRLEIIADFGDERVALR